MRGRIDEEYHQELDRRRDSHRIALGESHLLAMVARSSTPPNTSVISSEPRKILAVDGHGELGIFVFLVD